MRKVITSTHNPIIKDVCELKIKKHRGLREEFIVEGVRSTEEAVASGWEIIMAFVDFDAVDSERFQNVVHQLEALSAPVYEVPPEVMRRLTDTETPAGLLTVIKRKEHFLEDWNEATEGTILIVDEVRDPGNVGTIIRTADAAGISSVVLLSGCADVFAPKTVRATMGSIFHLPVVVDVEKDYLVAWAQEHGWQLVVSALEGAENLYTTSLAAKKLVVMGNEANGVSEEICAAADKKIFIPMQGKAESLNVAMATGIILFEGVRQQLASK